ncbi:MAG: metal-dependent transcriptional regulator [Anaerolineae bacterium]
MISPTIEDYLKLIYKLQTSQGKATTSAVAQGMGVSPASATSMIKKLAEMAYVHHTPYQGVELTPAGEKIALEVLRHHRLIELYLAEALGVPWDQVHEEAHRLEHAISEDLEDRIAEALGHPTTDPHGHPIPTKEGLMADRSRDRLSDLGPGQSGLVSCVEDGDASLLRYLGDLGLYPHTDVTVVARAPFDGPLTIRVGKVEHSIGQQVADQVFVDLLPPRRVA